MEWDDDGVVLSVRTIGETSVVLSLLTRDHGRHAGLVRGGVGRRARGVLQPGNRVACRWQGRLAEHLGAFGCELSAATAAAVLQNAAPLAAVVAACAVLDTALPEREPLPEIYEALLGLLEAVEHDPAWPLAYVRWEVGLLASLGFGLDLSACALTGTTESLVFVSPRTGRAVSMEAGAPWQPRLLALPAFLVDPAAPAGPSDIAAGLALGSHFLGRCVYAEHGREMPAARTRLPQVIARMLDPGSGAGAERGE
ncbi:MAG: DNA repair protein RecO [Rhodospirillales bacterium]|nr:DNA repair protein RecO [Rhodospirillales bacterium]